MSFRKRIDESRCGLILQEMMNVGLRSRTFKHSGSKRAGVNTTVPESYPTGIKFLNFSLAQLICLCQEHEVVLRHSYV